LRPDVPDGLSASEDADRPRLHQHVLTWRRPLALAAARRQLDLPPRPEAAGRQAERDVLEVRVEEEQEGVVAHVLPMRVLHVQLVAVQEDADRARTLVLPVTPRHAPPVGAHPPHVRQLLALAAEELRAPEHWMLPAQRDQAPRELEQLTVGVLPVEPRELVVLAPRVVVAALRAPELVAAEEHGH